MNWYRVIKTAKDIGHGNTLEGQMYKQEMTRIKKEVDKFRLLAASGGPEDVLPRWRGELRRRIFMLPAEPTIERMSMMELKEVSKALESISATMKKYSAARLKEIMGASNPRTSMHPSTGHISL